jgi:8-oxo-dGTP pyrophosphatase MutT (NUDIX family)
MNHKTLCLIFDKESSRILLGMKKRGFGEGKFNGFGGGVEDSDETIYHAAVREVLEECSLEIHTDYATKVGEIDFYFPHKEDWNQKVHVFKADYHPGMGEPKESDEMSVSWYDIKDIPFHQMWSDDKEWMPYVFDDKKIKAEFYFGEDNDTFDKFKIDEVQDFD